MIRSSRVYHPHNFHTLQTIVHNAWKLPFYKQLYSRLLIPKTIRSPEVFRRYPMLTRKLLYAEYQTLTSHVAQSYLFTARVDHEGEDISLPLSRRDYQAYVDLEQYKFQLLGIISNDRCAVVEFSQNATIPMAQAIMATGATYVPLDGDETEIFKNIIDQKITFIFTVPQVLYRFLDYVYRHKKQTSLRLVVTTGVKLQNKNQFVKRVKQLLGAQLMETIGSTELGTFAVSCKSNPKYFHFIDIHQYIELINRETNTVDTEGEIVITPLWKIDYPLIRFCTGDYVKLTDSSACSCSYRGRWRFDGIRKRTDNTVRIERYLMSLPEVYNKIVYTLLRQNALETILWRLTTPPEVVLILIQIENKDAILLFIENYKYMVFFKRMSRITNYLSSISSVNTVKITYCKKELLQTISPKYQDLRNVAFSRLPSNIQNLVHNYKSFFI